MKLVIMGPKGAGKTTIGKLVAEITNLTYFETDEMIENLYFENTGERKTCRQIFIDKGENYFRELEKKVAQEVAYMDWCLIITGGSIMLNPPNRRKIRNNSLLIYLTANKKILWQRISEQGIPPWLLDYDNPEQKYYDELSLREEILQPFADVLIDTSVGDPHDIAQLVVSRIGEELAIHTRSANTFGEIIRITTFGESHGPAIGAIMDGVRPGIEISEEDIQKELDRRKPGQSSITTRRKESDKVHILSGIFEGKTTGAPIGLIIYNEDQKSHHYDELKNVFRPGHADFTFYVKYGIRDHRGGGRSSGRETACRVACGAIAKKILERKGIKIIAHSVEIAGKSCLLEGSYENIENNPVRCKDPETAKIMEEEILKARKDGDSVGGIIQLEIHGIPPGLGDPVFAKLDARLAGALMSIGAVKGIEFGDGFELARLKGSQSNDPMENGTFLSNHAGGILGGISTGQPIIARLVVKPTSSIAKTQKTIDIHSQNCELKVHGRHDPCIVPRAIPVIESMTALTILDIWEVQIRLNPDWAEKWGTPL